jgi:hypothetical protein
LNPAAADIDSGEGVYYHVFHEGRDHPELAVFNRMTIEWKVITFGCPEHPEDCMCNFETTLFADGSVVLQYRDMPPGPSVANNWYAAESIGFEDRSGSRGVQIMYGGVPTTGTAYRIPPACHIPSGNSGAPAVFFVTIIPVLLVSASHPDTLRTTLAVDSNDSSCTGQCNLLYGSGSTRACACAFGCNAVRAGTRSDLHRGTHSTHNSACGNGRWFRYLVRARLAQLTALVWRRRWAGSRSGSAARVATLSTAPGTAPAARWSSVRTSAMLGASCRSRVGEELRRLQLMVDSVPAAKRRLGNKLPRP